MNSLDESFFFLGKVGGKGWEFELEGVVRDENSNPGKDDGSKGSWKMDTKQISMFIE